MLIPFFKRYLYFIMSNFDSYEDYPIDKALTVIKRYEGLHEELPNGDIRAYKDAVGIPTIGYGNTFYPDTGKKVKFGDIITRERAEEIFEMTVVDFADDIAKELPSNNPLNPDQFNAIISFVYNVGIGAFRSSTMLRKIRRGKKDEEVAQEFPRWNKAGGRVLKGLVKRRYTEKVLYLTGDIVFPDSVDDIS